MVGPFPAANPDQGDAWYLTISPGEDGDAVELTVLGRIGTESASQLERALVPFASAGRSILLDLGQMDYISSAGFGVLERIAKMTVSSGGTLAVTNLVEPVRLCFELAGPIPHLTIELPTGSQT